jgi:endo-1,4-beta-xylanase
LRRMPPRDPGPAPAPASPSGPESARTLSRRRFLQGAAGLTALVVLGAWPEPTAGAALPALTAAQLTGAMAALPRTGYVNLPGGGRARAVDVRAAAAAFAVADASVPNPATNPVAALGVLVALAAWSGHTGSLDLTVALPKAPVRPLRLGLPRLPAGASAVTPAGAVPPGLVVRPRGSVVFVGSTTGKRVIVALEDPARTVAGHPRLELAALPAADLAPLLAAAGARLHSSGTLVLLASGAKVALRPLHSILATRLLRAAGALYVDAAPIQPRDAATPLLTAQPIVPPPPASLVGVARVSQATDGRVLAIDGSEKAIGRAMPLANGSWSWVGHDPGTDYLLDYTPREVADANGWTLGGGIDPEAVGAGYVQRDGRWVRKPVDPAYVATLPAIANRVDYGGYNLHVVFYDFTTSTWQEVVANWPAISRDLANGIVPDGYPYYWDEADQVVAFARQHGLRMTVVLILESAGAPDSIYKGGFSAADLAKILEFAVKTRILHLRGKIEEWVVVSEAAADIVAGEPVQRFFYDKIGEGIIDEAYRWAHDVDPDAKLSFCEDQILRNEFPQLRPKFFGFLQHFRDAGIPVDRVKIENNMWIYVPPDKAEMITILRQIQGMGYEISSAETTVVTEDVWPTWVGRPRLTTVTDKVAAQTAIYRDVAEAYLEVGAPFGTGGFSDAYSWYNMIGHPNAAALLFDANMAPKPAYFAVRDDLKKRAGLT